jgi:acyl-CoA thioesterase-1
MAGRGLAPGYACLPMDQHGPGRMARPEGEGHRRTDTLRLERATIVFTGDSVTDCGRRQDPRGHLGQGYVRAIAESPRAAGATAVNTGTGGDRILDLQKRWRVDVLDHHADVVSILIGVNDTWRRYDSGEATAVAQYEDRYCRLLDTVAAAGSRLVLIEPFVLPVDEGQKMWRDDLNPKIEVVRRLAANYGAILVPADVELTRQSAQLGAVALTVDGVHPTELGHKRLAELWLDTVAGSVGDSAAVSGP